MPSSPSPPPAATVTPPPPQQPPPPTQPPPRKFPAPCWTQDETLALIHCYQDKWFSLRRRNLRTADWEAVAEEVNRRCPNQSPPKTSAQCRHKMEKLRKRYRAEKQRISNLPFHSNNTRFFPSSSWVFYDLMDAMEIGSAPGSTPTPAPAPGSQGTPQLVVKEEKAGGHVSTVQNGGKEDLGKYFDEILRSVGKTGIAGGPTTKFKVKNLNSLNHTFNHNFTNNDHDYDEGADDGDQGLFDDYGVFTNSKKRKLGEEEERRRMMRGGRMMNGVSAPGSSSMPKRRGGGGDEEVVAEMVASIRMLGEGMVKMEKMRMELMQDLQRQRMEFEMNNTRMILESQHNIVTAFLQGFKKQKHANNKQQQQQQQQDC